MKDFIIAKFNDVYGYIATGREKGFGFHPNRQQIIKRLEAIDKDYTYASPEELAVNDHQREWTKQDGVYYNKLKYFYERNTSILFKALQLSKGARQ